MNNHSITNKNWEKPSVDGANWFSNCPTLDKFQNSMIDKLEPFDEVISLGRTPKQVRPLFDGLHRRTSRHYHMSQLGVSQWKRPLTYMRDLKYGTKYCIDYEYTYICGYISDILVVSHIFFYCSNLLIG